MQDSITKAVEKGKLKIRRVDDMTSSQVEIQVHLAPGTSSDKTIDALYAFTDCEINISPNCCVIDGQKPQFLTVSDVLRRNVDHTKELLRQELEIRRHELLEQLFFASLEQIFIEERIYKGKPFENAKDTDQLIAYIDERLQPFYPSLVRTVGREDLLRLLEIKMQRIAKFSKDKNEELIAKIRAEIARIEKDLSEMTRVTVEWFEMLKEKYGKDHPRRTEIKSFDTIIAAKVAERNEKLYIDRQAGFIGTGLKKAELVENCSDHRRRHHLLPRRQVQGHQDTGQGLRRQEHPPRPGLQEERPPHDLQSRLSRRTEGPLLHQTLWRDLLHTRPRV